MSTFYRQGFFIPMVLSLLLLSVFIGYFLKTEYTKEKEAIIMDNRDEAFVALFTNIREASGPVEWIKDSLGNELIVQLELTQDTLHSEFISRQGSDTLITIHGREIEEVNDFFRVEYAIESDSIRKIQAKSHDNLRFRRSSKFNHDTTDTANVVLEMVEFPGHLPKKRRILESAHAEILPLTIWKRMVPQLLFSFLLLGSVGMAYLMIGKSLSKEKQLSNLRNEFMSNMSHELKTPVSTISVALEALSNFNAADNKALRDEYIDISKSEVERLGLLVDKALNISLFEQGKSIYDKQNVDLNEVIKDIVKTLKVQLDNQSVSLEFLTKGSDFLIYADKTHMTNVIHNLIENAVKYSGSIPEIRIQLEEFADSVKLSIEDNGQGIPPEYQDKVFDKFFRVPQGDRHNVKGHGLGLSYVKQVIEKHDGTIKVKSGDGVGTTFLIELPKNV